MSLTAVRSDLSYSVNASLQCDFEAYIEHVTFNVLSLCSITVSNEALVLLICIVI